MFAIEFEFSRKKSYKQKRLQALKARRALFTFIYLCRLIHLGLNSRKKSYESAIALGATGAVVCCYLGSFAPQGKAAGFLGNAQTVCCSVLRVLYCAAVCCRQGS